MSEIRPAYGNEPAIAIDQLDLELIDDQALALAQFVKRVGWSEFRANALDDVEAQTIKAAVIRLQDALARAGYAPR